MVEINESNEVERDERDVDNVLDVLCRSRNVG
jgi:hypothetical protein